MESTLTEFWTLVKEKKIATVVLLCPLVENGEVSKLQLASAYSHSRCRARYMYDIIKTVLTECLRLEMFSTISSPLDIVGWGCLFGQLTLNDCLHTLCRSHATDSGLRKLP